MAAFLCVQVAAGGLPSARHLWQMDAPCAQGVSDPGTCPGSASLSQLLVLSSVSDLAQLSLRSHTLASVIFSVSCMCRLRYLTVTRSRLLTFLEASTPLHLAGHLVTQCHSYYVHQAYHFRPLVTLLTFQLLSGVLGCGHEIAWSCLQPLVGIDLYALHAGLEKCRSELSQNTPMTSACGMQASTTVPG